MLSEWRSCAIDFSLPCSQQSTIAGEPLGGTALTETDAWLLVEYAGAWDAVSPEAALPERTQAWLRGVREQNPRLRLLLIRRERRSDSVCCFVARTPAPGAASSARGVFRFEARAHEDLAALDVDAVLDRGETAAEAQGGTRVAALYIVCA
ncbi:MAG: hypothetical protein EXR75_11220, partial [Myxococcales bacterium]|nr:hypothetical protein [Myxococcales bacterium]